MASSIRHPPPAAAPPPHMRMAMPDFELNERIGTLIGYATLALLSLIALLRLPSFIKYRLRATSRPASFKHSGYYLRKASGRQPAAPTRPPAPYVAPQAFLRPKLALLKAYHLPLPGSAGALLAHLNLGNSLVLLLYLALLILLALYRNTDGQKSVMNYKRFGFLAVAQFPLLFLLAMKNSPLSLLTGVGYERLNFLHRAVGRTIFVFAIIHGALQINLQHDFSGQIHFKKASLKGLLALSILAAINLVGLKIVRDCFYQLFLTLHVLGYIALIVVLWLHAECTRPFLTASIVVVGLDNLLKLVKTRVRRAEFRAMPGGLTRIEVGGLNEGWRAGQHVFLRVLKGRHIFEKHPFTIANAPNSSTPYGATEHMLIVAKAAGDFTERIHSLAARPAERSAQNVPFDHKMHDGTLEKDPMGSSLVLQDAPVVSYPVLVDGPYGTFFTDLTRYHTVLLCAGGSGFTYCMAALEDVIGQAVQSGASITKQVHVVWSVREPDMLASFSAGIEATIRAGEGQGMKVTMSVYETSKPAGRISSIDPHHWGPALQIIPDRPRFPEILNGLLFHPALDDTPNGLAVAGCGPLSFVHDLRRDVLALDPVRVQHVGGLSLHTEKFGW